MAPATCVSRRIGRGLAIAWFGLLVAASGPAFAHRETPAGRTDGVPIPTLTHGQMQVVARHFLDILDLADRQPIEDHTFRRLRNYISLQYATCLWGIMPASLVDEASPFNECSHGYLSAAHALLLHMTETASASSEADRLIDRISREMLADGAAMVLCRYSDDSFNTADVVSPHWSEIPSHAPSAIACLCFAGVIGGASTAGALSLRRPAPKP